METKLLKNIAVEPLMNPSIITNETPDGADSEQAYEAYKALMIALGRPVELSKDQFIKEFITKGLSPEPIEDIIIRQSTKITEIK
jgi:hypothetical protein